MYGNEILRMTFYHLWINYKNIGFGNIAAFLPFLQGRAVFQCGQKINNKIYTKTSVLCTPVFL